MKINVKLAKKVDINGLIEIYSEWKKFKGILPDKLIEIEKHEDLEKYFDGTNTTRKYLLAIDEKGNALGACYIDLTFISLNSVRLGDMMVKEQYRCKGIGGALVDKVIDYARKKGVKKIWLWTQEELEPAIKLYESKGFVLEGRQKKQFCSKDALVYGLVL